MSRLDGRTIVTWLGQAMPAVARSLLLTSGTVEVLEPVSTGCMASVWLTTTRLPNPCRLTKGSTSAGRPVARTGKEKSARAGRVRSLSLMELQKLEDLLRQVL